MWVIEEMKKHDINFSKCPIGIIPFGTGNDFARSFKWGGTVSQSFVSENGEISDYFFNCIKEWI